VILLAFCDFLPGRDARFQPFLLWKSGGHIEFSAAGLIPITIWKCAGSRRSLKASYAAAGIISGVYQMEKRTLWLEAGPQELKNATGAPELREVQAELEKELLCWFLHTSYVVPRRWFETEKTGETPVL